VQAEQPTVAVAQWVLTSEAVEMEAHLQLLVLVLPEAVEAGYIQTYPVELADLVVDLAVKKVVGVPAEPAYPVKDSEAAMVQVAEAANLVQVLEEVVQEVLVQVPHLVYLLVVQEVLVLFLTCLAHLYIMPVVVVVATIIMEI
jgi:hypothetical protein